MFVEIFLIILKYSASNDICLDFIYLEDFVTRQIELNGTQCCIFRHYFQLINLIMGHKYFVISAGVYFRRKYILNIAKLYIYCMRIWLSYCFSYFIF